MAFLRDRQDGDSGRMTPGEASCPWQHGRDHTTTSLAPSSPSADPDYDALATPESVRFVVWLFLESHKQSPVYPGKLVTTDQRRDSTRVKLTDLTSLGYYLRGLW